mgnify:CR=1 FL=1
MGNKEYNTIKSIENHPHIIKVYDYKCDWQIEIFPNYSFSTEKGKELHT